MAWKTLAEGKTRVNLSTAGARGQVFGTLYTVPAGKKALLKGLTCGMAASGNGEFELYMLESGSTDLSTVASNVMAMSRANTEDKTIFPIGVTTSFAFDNTAYFDNYVSRSTILAAGDVIKVWVHYAAAVTPGNTDAFYILSGAEF